MASSRFLCVQVVTKVTYCLLQVIQSGFLLGQVYFGKAVDHLRCLRLLYFQPDIICFLHFLESAHCLVSRVFANGPVDLGSIPGHVISKTLKWYLIPPWLTLSNIRSVTRVKWSNPGKGVAPSATPRCCSY